MRNIDASLLASMQSEEATLVHFIEIASPDTTGSGSLTKIVDGKLHDMKTSGLSDLSNFTDISGGGNWSLTGGRIKATASGVYSILRYDGYTGPTFGRMLQMLGERPVDNNPGGSGFIGLGFYMDAAASGWPPWYFSLMGKTALTGPGFWARRGESESGAFSIIDSNIAGHFSPIYHSVNLGPDDGGNYAAFGIDTFNRKVSWVNDPNPFLTDGQMGFVVKWEDDAVTPVPYTGDVFFDRLSVHTGPSVLVVGLPPGAIATIELPEINSGGAGVTGGTTSTSTGISTVDMRDQPSPYNKIRVNKGVTLLAQATSVEVWGGDIWQYTPAGLLPDYNFTNATERIVWGGKTWLPMHGAVQFSGVLESLDRRGQSVEL